MQFIRPYLNLKKGNSLPGNLPSPTHDNDNDQDASSYQDSYNNTDLCNNITITEEIPSTSTNNIVENKVVDVEPPLKKKKNSNNITSVDECVIDYIKSKQQRTSEENPKKLFLLSLLPDLNEINNTQFRKFRNQVNVLIDDILKTTQDTSHGNNTSLCSTPLSSWVSESSSGLDYVPWNQTSSSETTLTNNLTNIDISNANVDISNTINQGYYMPDA